MDELNSIKAWVNTASINCLDIVPGTGQEGRRLYFLYNIVLADRY